MNNLFNISFEIENVLGEVEENAGVITDEQYVKLEMLFATQEEKVSGLAAYAQELKANVEMIDREIDRLKARKESASNLRDNIRSYINSTTPADYKLKTPLFTIFKQKHSSVEIPEGADPEKFSWSGFVRVKYEWDKTKLKESLNNIADKALELGNSPEDENAIVIRIAESKTLVIR